MQTARRAVIDVGTNSVKLLVADVDGGAARPVWEEGLQTRLGEGFYETHRLRPQAVERTARAVARFVEAACSHGATSTRLIATSAARDALNQHELRTAIERQTGLTLEVISGAQEAEWAYLGVTAGAPFAGQRLLIMDAGGGSTEFVLGQGDHRILQQSFPLGAVRLLERMAPSDPPHPSELQRCRDWLGEFFLGHVKPALGEDWTGAADGTRLVGTGGTAVILVKMELGLEGYDRERIEATPMSRETLSGWVERLWAMPLAERKRIAGLPAPRADVILTGAAIYEAALQHLHFAEMRASTRGLRFAAVMQLPSQAVRDSGKLPEGGSQHAAVQSGRNQP